MRNTSSWGTRLNILLGQIAARAARVYQAAGSATATRRAAAPAHIPQETDGPVSASALGTGGGTHVNFVSCVPC